LWKDDDTNALIEFLCAFGQYRLQILPRILPRHCDWIASADNVFEKRVVQQALFDDKRDIADGLDDGRQNHRFQRGHVIADKHARGFQPTNVVQALNLNRCS
jgi:hypothetical protein